MASSLWNDGCLFVKMVLMKQWHWSKRYVTNEIKWWLNDANYEKGKQQTHVHYTANRTLMRTGNTTVLNSL